MKIPDKRYTPHKFAKHLHKYGKKTMDECVAILLGYGLRASSVNTVIKNMLTDEQLRRVDGGIDITSKLRAYFDGCEEQDRANNSKEVVKAPYSPPFRPWSGKYAFTSGAGRSYCVSGAAPEPALRGVRR